MSHHVESFDRYQAGQVWQHPTISPWGEHIILGFNADGSEVKLARPYAYASSVGTTGPTVLQGCETYTLPTKHLATWKMQFGGAFPFRV